MVVVNPCQVRVFARATGKLALMTRSEVTSMSGTTTTGVGSGVGVGVAVGVAVGTGVAVGSGVGVGCDPTHAARTSATMKIDRASTGLVLRGCWVIGYTPSLLSTMLSIRRVFPIRTAKDTRTDSWIASSSSRVSGLAMLM